MSANQNRFFKGHGLGNDYIALDPRNLTFDLNPENIQQICDRNWGIGSDGILTLEDSQVADFGLRIWNPDGSEAEKSGNGLRIFARYLHATGQTSANSFSVETKGGLVRIELHVDEHGDASAATVAMGRATFAPPALPCVLEVPELVEQPISAAGENLLFTGVSVGNPHCVIFKPKGDSWTREELLRLGPVLENHQFFPRRIQRAVGRTHRTECDFHRDMGARGGRDSGFWLIVLCSGQCGDPARTGDVTRDRAFTGRNPEDRRDP